MKTRDTLWAQDERWYHREGFKIVIHDDAPEEVKKSYEHYKEQKRKDFDMEHSH